MLLLLFLAWFLLFHEKNNFKLLVRKVSFINTFFGFLSSYVFQIPFSYLVFLILSCGVWLNMKVVLFQKDKL